MATYDAAIDNSPIVRITPVDSNGQPTVTTGSVAQPASSTATWTSATSLNTALTSSTTISYATATVTTIETGTTTTAGALTFEVFDGTNWWPVVGQQIGSYTVQSSYTLVNGTNVAWQFDVAGFQGFRTRLSTAITGTGSPQVVVIQQLQTATSTITPTVGLGQKLDATNDAVTSYPFGHSFLNIVAGQATTTVKSGAGVLHLVSFNSVATATNVTTFYDNTSGSGTVIAIPQATLATGLGTIVYDIAFSTGLTVVTATANGSNMTIAYR